MQKCIIGCKNFEFPYNIAHISRILLNVCRKFNILNMIFCISFDNTSNNIMSIHIHKQAIKLMLDGTFFNNCRVYHILNLCA